MDFKNISLYTWLWIGLILLTPIASHGQLTWPCDEDSPYPFPEMDNYEVEVGEEICIPIIVDDFVNVNGFTFFVYFDSRYLRFNSVNTSSSGLPNFTETGVLYVPAAGPDFLRVFWNSANLLPHTLPNGTVLFEACFEAIGPPGSISPYSITSDNQIPGFFIQDPTDLSLPIEEKNPCTFEDTTLITILPSTTSGPQLYLDNGCGTAINVDSGRVEFNIFSGTRPYTIVNADNNDNFPLQPNDSTFVLDNLPQGDYSYFVVDNTGAMSETVDFTIGDPLTFNPFVVRPPICRGDMNGLIELVVEGGAPFEIDFYRFEWSTGVQGIDEDEISRLDTGLYSVTVYDAMGCHKDTSFALRRIEPTVRVDEVNDDFCPNSGRGRLILSGTGGTPFGDGSYEFELNGLTSTGQTYNPPRERSPDSSMVFISVPAGNYVVTLYDSLASQGFCDPITSDTIVIGYSRMYSAEILSGDASACAPGMVRAFITLSADNPGNSFSYIISDTSGQMVATGNSQGRSFLSDCIPPGDYLLSIDDEQSCGLDTAFSLLSCDLQIAPLAIEPACFEINDGSIILNATSSFGPITYQWSTGDTTDQVFNLGAGVHSAIITDAAGCVLNEPFTFSDAQPWSVDFVVTQPSCPGGSDGSIMAVPSGGLDPYFYIWDPDPNVIDTETLSDISAGTYYVTVEDDDGCEIFDSVVVDDPTPPEFQITNIITPGCQGDSSGEATLTIVPNATYPDQFGYETSTGDIGGGTLSFTLGGLPEGDNWILVTHAISGCVFDTIDLFIPEGEPLMIDRGLSAVSQPSCFGGNDGAATIVATGPSGTDILWPDGTRGGTNINLSASVYPITISSGGCSSVDTLVIGGPDSMVIGIDQANSTFSTCDGSATDIVLERSGGNAGSLQWMWTDGAGAVVAQDSFLNNVPVGDYTVTATDMEGCIASVDFNVNPGQGLFFELGEISQPFCFGNQGTIRIDTAYGGSGGYRYQVNTSPAMDITAPFNVPSGDYTITVFDQDGCSSDTMITIDVPDQIVVDLGDDMEIGLGSSAMIPVNVTGAGGNIMVFADPNETVFCLDSSCTQLELRPTQNQMYTITVVDENGCQGSDEIFVAVERRESVYIPNVFMPTSTTAEAGNRTFSIFPGEGVERVNSIRIFDRWGNLVYFIDNPVFSSGLGAGAWDGTHGGQELDPGVFVYVVQVTLRGETEPITRRGDLTLIR